VRAVAWWVSVSGCSSETVQDRDVVTTDE